MGSLGLALFVNLLLLLLLCPGFTCGFRDLQLPLSCPTLFRDNISVIFLASNPCSMLALVTSRWIIIIFVRSLFARSLIMFTIFPLMIRSLTYSPRDFLYLIFLFWFPSFLYSIALSVCRGVIDDIRLISCEYILINQDLLIFLYH